MNGYQFNLQLLVVAPASSRPNRLISMLREAGVTLHTGCASTPSELALLLAGPWDVLLCYPNPGLEPARVLAQLRHHGQDIPVLLVDPPATASPLALYQDGVLQLLADDTELACEGLAVATLRAAQETRQRRQLQQLALDHQALGRRHDLLLDHSPTAYAYLRDGIHAYCNPRYAALFGYATIEAVRTTPLLNLVDEAERAMLRSAFSGEPEAPRQLSVRGRRQDGSQIMLDLRFTPVDYQGHPCLLLAVQPAAGNTDFEAEVERLDGRDLVTGLENLASFEARLENAVRSALQQHEYAALVVVEINDYSELCAALGKAPVPLLLNDVARHLREVSQGSPVARLREHEFGLLLPATDPDQVLDFCRRLENGFTNRLSSVMPVSLELSAKAGMAMINDHAHNASDLLERARHQLRQPAGQPAAYSFRIGDSLDPSASAMLDYLQLALQEQRFRLVYQAVVHLKGKEHLGYEVLLRLLDADGNEVPPSAFLPLANLNGIGEALDRMVLGRALQLLQTAKPELRLILNLTSNTLRSPTFLPWLSSQLQHRRLVSNRLIIELSEIDIHRNTAAAQRFCQGLNELGLALSISHFGCALEPFAILERVHPDFLKLDESLVRDLIYSTQQKAHVRAIIQQIHQRRLLVVTPHVEDVDALPILWDIGADYAQGYCLQAPSKDMNYEFMTEQEITLTASQQ